jgi:hypothetical protein
MAHGHGARAESEIIQISSFASQDIRRRARRPAQTSLMLKTVLTNVNGPFFFFLAAPAGPSRNGSHRSFALNGLEKASSLAATTCRANGVVVSRESTNAPGAVPVL